MMRRIAAVLVALCLAAGLFCAPAAALPGQCWRSPFGGFCDTDGWKDASFMHCENVGFGGSSYSNCYRACDYAGRPVMTDLDMTTPC